MRDFELNIKKRKMKKTEKDTWERFEARMDFEKKNNGSGGRLRSDRIATKADKLAELQCEIASGLNRADATNQLLVLQVAMVSNDRASTRF